MPKRMLMPWAMQWAVSDDDRGAFVRFGLEEGVHGLLRGRAHRDLRDVGPSGTWGGYCRAGSSGWRRERLPALPDEPFFSLAPDWACEVLSPSTAAMDRVKKLKIYARERVGHVWLVDPIAHTLEVLRLDGARWTIVSTTSCLAVLRAEPFEAIELDLSLLWEERRRRTFPSESATGPADDSQAVRQPRAVTLPRQ